MLKLRYYIRFFQAFIQRFKALLVVGVLLGFVFFLSLNFIFPLLLNSNTERIGYAGRFTPDTLPLEIKELIGDGLVTLLPNGNLEPNLASSWEFKDDGKTWVFHLDKSKTWQDGKLVTADSLNYSFSDASVETPDAQTIVFRLKEKFSPFPSVVSVPIFKKDSLIGTDSWKVSKLSLVGNLVEYIILQNKDGSKKTLKFYPSEERVKTAFQLGEIDKIADMLDPKPLIDWKTVKVEENIFANRYVAVFFNTQDHLLGESKSLRQALSYAINKDNLSTNRALGPISPESWAFNPQIKDYAYDPKRAKELLEDIPKEELEHLTMKLTTTSNLREDAEKIAKNWNDIGVKTTINMVSGIPSEYQAFLAIYDSPYDPDQYVTWHSSQQATNISKYSDPRIDKLLEDGRLETDTNGRKITYFDFQRFLLEDAPAAFLYHPTSYTISRK